MLPQAQPLSQVAAQQFGPCGGINIGDTNSHTGDWYAVEAIEDSVFTEFVESGFTGDSITTAVSLKAGSRITNGLGITQVKLASGFVRCLNRNTPAA